MATRKAAGGIVVIPVKAATTIAMNGLVCVDATGYAVAGGDTAGLKFVGIAAQGVANAGVDGAKTIKVWTEGVFKITTVGGAVTDQGKTVYATGAATVADTSTNGIEVGKCVQYVSATSIWVQINQAAGDVSVASIPDDTVTLAKIASAARPILHTVAAGVATMSREQNVAGLSSAIALANSLKTVMNAHAADAVEHSGGADVTSFPVATANATNLATLLTLAGALLTAYDGHDNDAEQVAPTYHDATEAGDHSLTSAVTPTTLQEAVTRLNDLRTKYNAHDADATAHGTGSTHQEATAAAAYGAANLVPVAGAIVGDTATFAILNDGTGNVTGVSASPVAAGVTFTFSADPQNDTIIAYQVFRAAA